MARRAQQISKQKEKYNRGNSCAFLLASSTPVAKRYAQQKFKGHSDRSLHCLWEFNEKDLRALPSEEKHPSAEVVDRSASNAIIRELFYSYAEHESYMSEIQLRRIVDKMANGSAE